MIGNSWDEILKVVWNSENFKKFYGSIISMYDNKKIFPEKDNIFNALKLTPYENVKVVIMGQDPYHGVGEAHGLSFSVQQGVKLPPSLQNIYKELYDDLGIYPSSSGDLSCWAKAGVLLLNSVLTVEMNKPNSHKDIGWERMTDYIIRILNNKKEPVVFILWGNYARAKKRFITNPIHFVIESPHPSPFSAYNGFFGSKPFSRTNEFLVKNNIEPINWQIKEPSYHK